ncbi:MAG: response regulator [Bradymonadia bacterium]
MSLMDMSPQDILVIDDEELLRGTLNRLLTHLGHTVTEARDGIEALNIYDGATRSPLVILDINMPGLTPEEIVAGIIERNPGARIILTSGEYDASRIEQLCARGAEQFLAKPFSLEELTRALKPCT